MDVLYAFDVLYALGVEHAVDAVDAFREAAYAEPQLLLRDLLDSRLHSVNIGAPNKRCIIHFDDSLKDGHLQHAARMLSRL